MTPESANLAREVEVLRQRLELIEQERVAERQARTVRLLRAVALCAVLAMGTAGVALGSSPCMNGIPWCFAGNDPALASEVNTNFAALKTWIEAKVGPTGTTAAPSRDITTGKLIASTYAPTYADWNSFVTGGGGAGIVNDNQGYKALMLVGNTSGSAERRIVMYDDVTVASDLNVVGNVVRSGYQIACAGGESGYHFGFCCRINVRSGAATCRNGLNTTFASWDVEATLFIAGADSHYSLSCMGHRSSANYPLCCRTNNAGSTECKVSINGGPLVWTNAASPW